MGCDIHCYTEGKDESSYVDLYFSPFGDRSYGVFGFLADVRNYSGVEPISKARGLPKDIAPSVKAAFEYWGIDGHSCSWLSVAELVAFDYDTEIEDRRYVRQEGPNYWNGSATCEVGQGKKTTYREFLGKNFFRDLKELQDIDAERVIFWFDN